MQTKTKDGEFAVSGGNEAPPVEHKIDIGPHRCEDVLAQIADRIERRKSGQPLGVRTGYGKLDEMLGGGFQPGKLYVLGAPPGTGKSALASRIARTLSLDGGRVLYVTYEVSPDDTRQRALCDIAGVKGTDVQLGKVDMAQLRGSLPTWQAETEGIGFVDATRGPKPTQATILKAASGLKGDMGAHRFLLIIDYLQRAAMYGGYDQERDYRLKVAMLSHDLTQIARECDVPVLALASVSRKAYDDPEDLSCFKEAGDIESDADCCMTLGPRSIGKDAWKEHRSREIWELSLRVLKGRHGPTGQIDLDFNRPYLRFSEA